MQAGLVAIYLFASITVGAEASDKNFDLTSFVAGKLGKLEPRTVETVSAKIQNEKDKATFRNFLNSWQPKSGLVVVNQPWHLEIYSKGKKKIEMTWLLTNPVVARMDGKIVVLDREYDSLTATMEALWDQRYGKGKTALLTFVLPEAHAEGESDFKKLAITYSIDRYSIYGDAKRAFSGDSWGYYHSLRANLLPKLTKMESWTWKNLKCTAKGIEDQSFEHAGKKVTLKAQSPLVYDVEGVTADGSPMRLTFNFNSERAPSKWDAISCGNKGITGEQECDQIWKDFLDATPGAEEKLNADANPTQNCRIFDKIEVIDGKIVENYPCQSFMQGRYQKLRPNRVAVSSTYRPDLSTLVSCPSGQCEEKAHRTWTQLGAAIDPAVLERDKTFLAAHQKGVRAKFIDVLKKNGVANAETYCEGTQCRIPPEAARMTGNARKELSEALPSERDKDPLLPSQILGIEMNGRVEEIGLGMLLMADCCNKAECKRALYKNFSVNLQDAPAGDESKARR